MIAYKNVNIGTRCATDMMMMKKRAYEFWVNENFYELLGKCRYYRREQYFDRYKRSVGGSR